MRPAGVTWAGFQSWAKSAVGCDEAGGGCEPAAVAAPRLLTGAASPSGGAAWPEGTEDKREALWGTGMPTQEEVCVLQPKNQNKKRA